MADPVSLLGTLPALVTLPAVTLQAVQTIQNFSKSLKNATIDVQQLLNEVEMMKKLLQHIRAQCDQAAPQGVEHNDLQDLLQVIGLLNERMEAPLKELRELRESMKKPSRTSFNITSRIRKYLSEGEVKDHLDHLLRLVVTLQLIYLKTDAIRMQQLHEKTDAIQQDVHLLTQRLPNPNASTSTVPQPSATNLQKELSLDTRSNTHFPRRTRKKSKCIQGLCGCMCHRISNYQRSWLVSGQNACLVACGCADRKYQWTVSLFGRLITFKAGFRENGETSIGWSISPSNTVPRTSPGFVVIERCKAGALMASEASRGLRVLLSSGVISAKDRNPDGKGYIDVLLHGPWLGDVGSQIELLETLTQEDCVWESDKLLRCLLRWVGEGPYLHLLKNMLRLFDFTQGFQPETMIEWPDPIDSDVMSIFAYPDLLFIEVIAKLVAEDPDFGGTTPLQAAVLCNDFDRVEKLLHLVPSSDLFAKNFRGQSALHLAVCNPRMVSLLLRSGYSSNLNPTDEYGMTPLTYAAAYGIIETTKILLQAGANPFRPEEISNMSMWHYALFCQPTEFIQEIIEFCMTASSQMANYAIELCLLIRMGHRFAVQGDIYCSTLEYLLRTRSTQRIPFMKDHSLLHFCTDTYKARLLLTYGCDGINQQNGRGYTPAMVLSRLSAPGDVLRMLVEQKADVRLLDNHRMSAIHHLNASTVFGPHYGASNKEELIDWLNATAVLLSAGGDMSQGDSCSCPCSSTGCSPIRGLFWESDDVWNVWELFRHRKKRPLEAIPRIVEFFLVLKNSGEQKAIVQAILDIHRYQTFEEWGMTHTCCIHDGGWYYDGPRPQVDFHCPKEDYHMEQGKCNVEKSKEWDSEFVEITNEQEELAQLLDETCADYAAILNDAIEDRLLQLLARRVVLLEYQLERNLAKERRESRRNRRKVRPELPPKELLIREFPLHYIDKKEDRFVQSMDCSGFYGSIGSSIECKFEYHHDTFLGYFSTDLLTYPYMGGQTRQAWDTERNTLLSNLYQKVLRFRSVPPEKRGWDVDLIQKDDSR